MDYSFTYAEVVAAFDDCLKHKKNTKGAKDFCLNKISNLLDLTDEINSRTYKIGTSQAFIITDPKVREVFAAAFRDRIVHHLIIRELEPYFERYFIGTTFSCMKGRGTLHGVEKLASILDERSEHYTKPYYIAKLDYQSFFMSLDKELLRKGLDNFILQNYPDNRKRECLRWLCEMVVLHHPEDDCEKVGNISLWKLLPPSKSLFFVGKDKGLAIGNLTSQMLANFYLTPFDYKAKELGLDIVRYADDFTIGHPDLEYLKSCIPILKEFAKTHLKLTVHPDKLYMQECSRGVTFVGAIIKQNRIYCGHRAVGKMYDKVASRFSEYSEKGLDNFVSSVNSYLGLMRHYKSYKIRKHFVLSKLGEWLPYIVIGKDYKKINRLS